MSVEELDVVEALDKVVDDALGEEVTSPEPEGNSEPDATSTTSEADKDNERCEDSTSDISDNESTPRASYSSDAKTTDADPAEVVVQDSTVLDSVQPSAMAAATEPSASPPVEPLQPPAPEIQLSATHSEVLATNPPSAVQYQEPPESEVGSPVVEGLPIDHEEPSSEVQDSIAEAKPPSVEAQSPVTPAEPPVFSAEPPPTELQSDEIQETSDEAREPVPSNPSEESPQDPPTAEPTTQTASSDIQSLPNPPDVSSAEVGKTDMNDENVASAGKPRTKSTGKLE